MYSIYYMSLYIACDDAYGKPSPTFSDDDGIQLVLQDAVERSKWEI